MMLEYARPLVEIADTPEGVRRALGTAELCFNWSFIRDDAKRERMIADLAQSYPEGQDREDFLMVVETMMKRARQMFAGMPEPPAVRFDL